MEKLRDIIIKKELEFPETFANKVEEDFGVLFFSESNPLSHDSNHAVIYPERVKKLDEVLAKIAAFYTSKGLQPRIYQAYIDSYLMDNAATFRKNSWDVQIYGQIPFMVLKEKNEIRNDSRLNIVRVSKWDDRIAEDILIPNGSLYEMDVLKQRLKNPNVEVFAGYMGSRAVSIASVDYVDDKIARMDSAETAEELRGRGFARELISFVVEYHKKNHKRPLYLWPLNKTAEKIFYEAGFRTEFTAEAASAIYNRV